MNNGNYIGFVRAPMMENPQTNVEINLKHAPKCWRFYFISILVKKRTREMFDRSWKRLMAKV